MRFARTLATALISYKDTSRDLTLSWNKSDDGSYISKAIYRFDVEFEKAED